MSKEDNPTIKERLTAIETNQNILIKINSKDHNEIKTTINSLSKHVNDQANGFDNRLNTLEINFATGKKEWTIYKSVALFLGGGIVLTILSCIIGYIIPRLFGG